jgi:osmotically-inducible protein OsmY
MKSDSEIKRNVEDDLRGDPDIDPTDIAVAVNNGAVRSWAERQEAERRNVPRGRLASPRWITGPP